MVFGFRMKPETKNLGNFARNETKFATMMDSEKGFKHCVTDLVPIWQVSFHHVIALKWI